MSEKEKHFFNLLFSGRGIYCYENAEGVMALEGIDRAKAARVWQRVKADGPPADHRGKELPAPLREEGLPELIAGAWTDGFLYTQVSRKLRGRKRELLQQMTRKKQAQCACLKGIYTLVAGRSPVVKAVKPAVGEPMAVLRRCYSSSLQALVRYEARATQGEYGQVFSQLARQEREIGRQILELLGDLK